jgi:hypothetical protein
LIAGAGVTLHAVYFSDDEPIVDRESPEAPLTVSEGGTGPSVGAVKVQSSLGASASSPATGPTVPGGLVRHERIGCSGTTRIDRDGIIIEAVNRMAVATGNSCQVYLSNCELSGSIAVATAGDSMVSLRNCTVRGDFMAINAGEQSKVYVEGGSLKGSTHAATVMGLSELHLKGVQVDGPVKSYGQAKVVRQP